jgi:hypothetical protein
MWRGKRSAAKTFHCRTIACSGNGDDTIINQTGTTLLIVGALPFKYTESVVSAASALNCAETALC